MEIDRHNRKDDMKWNTHLIQFFHQQLFRNIPMSTEKVPVILHMRKD